MLSPVLYPCHPDNPPHYKNWAVCTYFTLRIKSTSQTSTTTSYQRARVANGLGKSEWGRKLLDMGRQPDYGTYNISTSFAIS